MKRSRGTAPEPHENTTAMIYIASLPFLDIKSGKITFTPPSSYVAATGSGNCQTGQQTLSGQKWRAFFNFNTSSIPSNAQIEFVGFLIYLAKSQPFGRPEIYRLKFSIGTFIGAALDGNAAEFNAGTLMVTLDSKPGHGTLLDLDQDGHGPEAYVNRTGETDVKVWDDSIRGSGDSSWGLDFNRKYSKCRLHIMYTVPAATATGRGSATASATVSAASSATATGRGTVEVAAAVEAAGSATGTGLGAAALIAAVTAAAGATVTGRGIASCSSTAVYFEPLARHFGTRSVGAAHAGIRSVSCVHSASRQCDPDDVRLRGARRLS